MSRKPPAKQSLAVGHATVPSTVVPVNSVPARRQVRPPSELAREIELPAPRLATATHVERRGQETLCTAVIPAGTVPALHVAPPSVV